MRSPVFSGSGAPARSAPPSNSRRNSAASTDWVAYIPAARSATATPTRTGGRPSSPVMLIIPPSACIIRSYAGRSAFGPVCPYPVIEQYTNPGFDSRSVS